MINDSTLDLLEDKLDRQLAMETAKSLKEFLIQQRKGMVKNILSEYPDANLASEACQEEIAEKILNNII